MIPHPRDIVPPGTASQILKAAGDDFDDAFRMGRGESPKNIIAKLLTTFQWSV